MSPGNEQIVGTCSCCGGPVSCPISWLSVVPPVPKCRLCGATAAESYGPVIPMRPAPVNPVVTWPSIIPPVTWTTFTTDRGVEMKVSSTGVGKWKDEWGNEWTSECATNDQQPGPS